MGLANEGPMPGCNCWTCSNQRSGLFLSAKNAADVLEKDKDGSVALEAHNLVHGPREADYDHPLADFTRTVGMINAAFAHKLKEPFVPGDFAIIMILCKVSREAHKSKRDNLVDICGYAETKSRIEEGR